MVSLGRLENLFNDTTISANEGSEILSNEVNNDFDNSSPEYNENKANIGISLDGNSRWEQCWY